eukprot:TRINITY_DN49091_c0_g1_i1.p1 TRINITY_DN49091_c0_g1~~TRINITY_DN49091_c0_g1_i1.p1  ORF type:complete len:1139 (-),score=196.03 TRINITY_DN49091_c0_g1_i1:147-3563(-)
MSTTSTARDAFEAFYSADFGKCRQFLDQIGNSRGSTDVKASHNTFLNEYYRSGCSDPRHLLIQLNQAHDRARDRDKKDKGRRKKDEDDEESYREDEDLSVLRYNQALLCLQLRQYAQATLILEELFENIEPIDDFLAIKICFLLLELCLLQREPEQAVPVLAYLEKPNAFLTVLRSERPSTKGSVEGRGDDAIEGEEGREKGRVGAEGEEGGDEASGATQDGSAVVAAAGGMASSTTAVGTANSSGTSGDGAVTGGRGDASEGPLPSLTLGAFLPRHGRAPDTISRAEYRFYCHMYRARINGCLKNIKAAKKDVKSAVEVLEQELRRAPLLTPHPHTTGVVTGKAGGHRATELVLRDSLYKHQHAMAWSLKAYLEYMRQNLPKSVKLMSMCQFNFAQSRSQAENVGSGSSAAAKAASKRREVEERAEDSQLPTDFHPAQDEACAAVFNNNLGCIHFMMRKPNLATLYFQKALKAPKLATPPPTKQQQQQQGAQTAAEMMLGGRVGLTRPGVCATRHWLDRRAETSYNAGLQLLMCERPVAAFKCFEQCVPTFRTWPRLWIRLAECCIEIHRQSLSPTAGGAGESRESASGTSIAGTTSSTEGCVVDRPLVWTVQGTGPHRRWLLTRAKTQPLARRNASAEDDSRVGTAATAKGTSGPSAAGAQPPVGHNAAGDGLASRSDGAVPQALVGDGALTHAAMCLRNVLVLTSTVLPSDTAASDAAQVASDGAAGDDSSTTGGGGGADKAGSAGSAGARGATKAAVGGGSAKIPGIAGSHAVPRQHVREVLESEASLVEDSALVKMAYVSLCQRDTASALRHSRKLLEKNHLVPLATSDGPGGLTTAGKQGGAADEADQVRRLWGFQAQNFAYLAHGGTGLTTPGSAELANASGGTSSATVPKFPSSVGCAMLGVLYAAEALLVSGKTAEAKALLGSFVHFDAASEGVELQTNTFQEIEQVLAAHVVGGGGRKSAAEGNVDADGETIGVGDEVVSPSMGGLTSTSHVLCGAGGLAALQAAKNDEKEKNGTSNKESGHAALVVYPPSEFPRLGDSQCMLRTNLAAIHVQEGNLDEAERCCEKALEAQPRALAPLRTLVYILLRRGEHSEALAILKRSRTQTAGATPVDGGATAAALGGGPAAKR